LGAQRRALDAAIGDDAGRAMMFLEGASELTTFWQSVRMIKSGRGAGLAALKAAQGAA
jgi:hypothetical protein